MREPGSDAASRPRCFVLGRTLAWTLAALALAGAACFFFESRGAARNFAAWQTAEPIRLKVDLSKPGIYSGTFRQTCSSAHGDQIALSTPAGFATEALTRNAVQGLGGRLRIEGSDHVILYEVEFSDVDFWPAKVGADASAKFAPSLEIAAVRRGTHVLRLEIEDGAPALAGVPQELVARYDLCGLERMPVLVFSALAVGLAVLSGLSGLVGMRLEFKRRSNLREAAPPRRPQD